MKEKGLYKDQKRERREVRVEGKEKGLHKDTMGEVKEKRSNLCVSLCNAERTYATTFGL